MTDVAEHGHMHVPAGWESVPPGWYTVPAYAVAGYQPRATRFGRFIDAAYLRSPRWTGPLAVLACFFGGVAYTIATHPASSGAFDSPSCIVKLTTGFDCPGCGGTRAFWFLLHGNLAGAARSHLLAVFAAPFLVYMYVAWSLNSMFRLKIPNLRLTPRVVSGFLIVWAIFTVLRNLPFAPFTWFYV